MRTLQPYGEFVALHFGEQVEHGLVLHDTGIARASVLHCACGTSVEGTVLDNCVQRIVPLCFFVHLSLTAKHLHPH